MLRTIRARISILACLVLLFSSLSATHSPIRAAGAQPTLLLPLSCGTTASVGTYPKHTRHAADLNIGSGADDRGLPVLAAAAGRVVRIWAANGEVDIDHGEGWATRYAHLDPISVELNQQINQGLSIGKIGSRSAFGAISPHLHFSIKRDGSPYPGIVQGVVLVRDWSVITSPVTSKNCGGTVSKFQIFAGDFNGDGLDDLGLRRINTGEIYIKYGSSYSQQIYYTWAGGLDFEIFAGDFNGDGLDDLGLRKVSTGVIYIKYGPGPDFGPQITYAWAGGSNYQPFSGDFNGDGLSDLGLRKVSTGVSYIRYGPDFGTQITHSWAGGFHYQPFSGDFNGDGLSDLGLRRIAEGVWYIRYGPGPDFGPQTTYTWAGG